MMRRRDIKPSPPLNRLSDESGFTLLEVLLASALLTVILGMIYVSFDQTASLSRHVDKVSNQYREARLILSKFNDEIASAWHATGAANSLFTGEDGIGKEGFDADSLMFTSLTRVLPETGPGSRHHNLRYHLEGRRLIYTETLNPLGIGAGNVMRYELIDGLLGFRLRYMGKGDTDWSDQWVPGAHPNPLPRAVEVSLLFVDANADAEAPIDPEVAPLVLSTVVRVPMGGA